MFQDPFADLYPQQPNTYQRIAVPEDPAVARKRELDMQNQQERIRLAREASDRANAQASRPQPIPGHPGFAMGPDGRASRIPGLPADAAKGEDDVKIQQKRAALTSLEQQINRVDELYRKGFKDESFGILSSLSEYLPSDEASALNTAGAGLAEQGLAAFRVPGVGSQSDTELRQFVEANRPSSWDRDVSVEEKLNQLRGRVNATRQEMGLPPAKWLGRDESAMLAATYEGNNGEGGGYAPAGDMRRVDDPALSGLKGEYLRRLEAGQSAQELLGWMQQAGVPVDSPQFVKSIQDQVAFRRQNPNVKISNYDVSQFDDRFEPTTGFQRTMNDASQSALGAYGVRAGNAVTMNTLDNIVGMTGGNAEQARIGIQDAGRNHPMASLAGDLSGGALAALSGEAGLARLGMAPGAMRGIAADMGFGAGAGAGAADGGNRLQGAAVGAGAGFLGNRVGAGLARGAAGIVGGPTQGAAGYVAREQVPMTIGQAVGGAGRVGAAVKGLEDRLAGLPVVGDMVNARRTEGLVKMNQRSFDRALAPINATVGDKFGEEAVAEANDQVSAAFQRALAGKSAQLDRQFMGSAAAALNRIRSIRRDNLGEEIVGQVEEATRGYFDPQTGVLTGENMQALLGSLRQIRQSYKNDPLAKRIGDDIKRIEGSVEAMFQRQAPEVMPAYNKAKQAYRRVSVIADTVNRAKNNPEGGSALFTPAQLGMSDRANSMKFDGKVAAASGRGQFHDFQRNMQEVLPNRVPDSGTAGRAALLMAPGMAAGGMGVGAIAGDPTAGAQTGLGLAGILSLLYTRRGQGLLTARGPGAQAAGRAIDSRSRAISRVGGATGVSVGTYPYP